MDSESVHKTVLLNETIDGLGLLGKNPVVLDATFGGGGHSGAVCKKFPGAQILALDQDAEALKRGKEKFKKLPCEIKFTEANFREIGNLETNLETKFPSEGFDGMIFDLGLSSDQLENSGRGFSFMKDEPLLMTMKENPRPEDITAREIVNTWEEENLATVIYGYGEERYAKRIAHGIWEARKHSEIKTTFELTEVIKKSVPASYRKGRIHPATRTFQALRIVTNDELGALSEGLKQSFQKLKSGGRLAVISFHSLEDRIVKRFFIQIEREGQGRKINKKPIIPNKQELKENPRGRSAKLRIIEKITATAEEV